MFASLKNKIKEETGNEVTSLSSSRSQNGSGRFRFRSSTASVASIQSFDDSQHGGDQKDILLETASFDSKANDLLKNEIDKLKNQLSTMEDEKHKLVKNNESLLQVVETAQTEKDSICNEQEKLHSQQTAEITKLKSLLAFREQEAVDRLATIKQNQQQMENLTGELERLKMMEPMVDDLQDELERLRHSAQLEKNNLTTTLAAIEEENRTLKDRLKIVEQSRLESISTLSAEEKVQALIQERKLLEQHLEEAQLQLSDIKSSWSGQNLALETQVSRLSKQVAEETTEKRKALQTRDEHAEKIKQLEFELEKKNEEIEQKDNKIKILEDEVTDMSNALKTYREDSEEEITILKQKVVSKQ